MTFQNRHEAGRKLADALSEYKGADNGLVIALPRGGVVPGRIVADRLGLPLDVVVTRKVGAPANREYAIGALTESGDVVWNQPEKQNYPEEKLSEIVEEEKTEARRRVEKYRSGLPSRKMRGKTILLVDDGVATGFTMKAAIKTVRAADPDKIIVAVPVAPRGIEPELESVVHEVVVLETPALFMAVGAYYEEFDDVNDEQVLELLKPYRS